MMTTGLVLLFVSFIVGVWFGEPSMSKFNWADRVAQFGIYFGSMLMAASLLVFVWRVLP